MHLLSVLWAANPGRPLETAVSAWISRGGGATHCVFPSSCCWRRKRACLDADLTRLFHTCSSRSSSKQEHRWLRRQPAPTWWWLKPGSWLGAQTEETVRKTHTCSYMEDTQDIQRIQKLWENLSEESHKFEAGDLVSNAGPRTWVWVVQLKILPIKNKSISLKWNFNFSQNRTIMKAGNWNPTLAQRGCVLMCNQSWLTKVSQPALCNWNHVINTTI